MKINRPFYKINFEDIEIASEFFDHNQKHLSEFIMATIAYYSGKNVEIKSKLVEKYFKTYKKTMDFVMLSKGYGKKGALIKAENQIDSSETLKGVVEAPLAETLPTNNELLNNNNKELSEKNEIETTCLTFESFWELYDKKVDSKKCKDKFNKVKESDRQKILDTLTNYIKSTPDIKFRKNPSTYLNNECWNDIVEIIESTYPKTIAEEHEENMYKSSLRLIERGMRTSVEHNEVMKTNKMDLKYYLPI